MAISIIFTTYTRNGLKYRIVNKLLYYAKLVLKKRQVFQVLKRLWCKSLRKPFWRNNGIDNIDKNFHAVFLNSDRRRLCCSAACHVFLYYSWLLTLLVTYSASTSSYSASNLKLLKYKLQIILNNVKCSRNFEFEKRADQNFITQNLHHGNIAFRRKETIKTISKGTIYIFWLLPGGSPFFGWWWMVVDGGIV